MRKDTSNIRSRITRRGSPFYSSRNGYRPEAIVIHIAEGSFAALRSWFNNPKAQVSAHYGVSKEGRIDQYVDERHAAWHAGKVEAPSWQLLKPGVNPNLYTIGIEHEGFAGEPWTEAMYEASAALIRDICHRWGIPIDRHHVIGHREIRASKSCPGRGVSLDKLIQLARRTGEARDSLFHIVSQGETLGGIACQYGTTVAALRGLNPAISNPDRIYPGQKIRLR